MSKIGKKRKISPKNARQKGLQFERDIANLFVRYGWIHAKRHLEYQAQEANGCDIDNTHPFVVQCKRHANYATPKVLDEIKILHPEEVPVVITAGNNKPAAAILPLDHFMLLARTFKLYTELHGRVIEVASKAIEYKEK